MHAARRRSTSWRRERRISGASAIARTLRAHGVSTVFGLCGDHTNPIVDALVDTGIRIVDARDERGAAWMAAGWALATGSPGVVLVSNAPGLTNAATALADSTASGIPVLCITGGIASDDRGRGHPGDVDQVALAAPLSKWAARVEGAEQAGEMVARALSRARSERPGVATLEVPLDAQHCDGEPAAPIPLDALAPDAASLDRAAALLAAARAPVVLAGSGVWWSGAGEELRAFVERAHIPVFTVRAARGLIGDDHDLCMGFPNLLTEATQLAFAEADVALVVGCELDVLIGGGNFHPGCTMIRIDADPSSHRMGRRAEVEITADPRAVLAALGAGASALPTSAWIERLRAATGARATVVAQRGGIDSTPLHPGRVIAEIAAKLPADAIVCVDAGEFALWAIDGIPARAPSSLHFSSASRFGALGMGLPWAIGMKLARPDRPVVALVGDGSFGFTAMEIETSARHQAPVAVVIGNDGGWGIVRHLQQALHGRAVASDLPRSPYELLAEFAGGVGDAVETPQQLGIAVTNALVAKVPSIVNVHIDANVRHEAIPLIAQMFAAKAR